MFTFPVVPFRFQITEHPLIALPKQEKIKDRMRCGEVTSKFQQRKRTEKYSSFESAFDQVLRALRVSLINSRS